MSNSSNPPPADPKPKNNNNKENNHPRQQWPPQSKMTPSAPPQMQQQNNWHWPSMHPPPQFQHGYGQHAPMRHYMMQRPPPNPVWHHQYYPQQQNQYVEWRNHPQQQNENWSCRELRRLLDIQRELTKELTKDKNDLERQKNDLEGRLKEFSAKLKISENDKEANLKLEKKTSELDAFLARIEQEKGQKEEKTTETDPIDFVEHPLTLPSPAPAELDTAADELPQLKNELDNKIKLIKKMEAEMGEAKEELKKLMDAQNGNKEEMAKKKESLENWEEKLKAREERFTEEKEIAIAQCRSEADGRITQIQVQLLAKNTELESKEKEISKLKGQNRQISKELDGTKSSRDRLLRELQQIAEKNNALEAKEKEITKLNENLKSTKDKLLEGIYIEGEKLKKQANRCEQLNLELASKEGQIAEKDEELKAKIEEMEKMKEMHKITMNNFLEAYKNGLTEKDEKIKNLRNEIEKKEKQWKAEREEKAKRIKSMQQEISKMQLDNDEIGEKASKALAKAGMHEFKFKNIRKELAAANEEKTKIRDELVKMETLVRTADKENKEKQKQLDKIEAKMEEKKREKKELVLRIKKEIEQPPQKSTFDEMIQAMDETMATKKQRVKKTGGGIGRGKRRQKQQYGNESDSEYEEEAPSEESDSDYQQPPGAKKKRTQKNANPTQPITNSIACTPSTSSNLQPSKSKQPTKLCKSAVGKEIGASATTKQKLTTKGTDQQVKEKEKEESSDLESCEHWYSADCEKCKERYGI